MDCTCTACVYETLTDDQVGALSTLRSLNGYLDVYSGTDVSADSRSLMVTWGLVETGLAHELVCTGFPPSYSDSATRPAEHVLRQSALRMRRGDIDLRTELMAPLAINRRGHYVRARRIEWPDAATERAWVGAVHWLANAAARVDGTEPVARRDFILLEYSDTHGRFPGEEGCSESVQLAQFLPGSTSAHAPCRCRRPA